MATGRPCTVCRHPERDAIDAALVVAGASVSLVSRRFALTSDALARHRDNHMPRAALHDGAQAVAEAEGTRGAALLRDAANLRGRAMTLLDAAEAANNIRAANGSLREARECLKLEAQLLGELDADSTTVNVLVAPAFISVQAVILTALARHPEARADVVRALEAVR